MARTVASDLSAHMLFGRPEWAKLRASTPQTLEDADLQLLRSLNEPVSLDEVADVYLPMTPVC